MDGAFLIHPLTTLNGLVGEDGYKAPETDDINVKCLEKRVYFTLQPANDQDFSREKFVLCGWCILNLVIVFLSI